MKQEVTIVKNTAIEIANIFHSNNETSIKYLESALKVVYLEGAIDQLETSLKINKDEQ